MQSLCEVSRTEFLLLIGKINNIYWEGDEASFTIFVVIMPLKYEEMKSTLQYSLPGNPLSLKMKLKTCCGKGNVRFNNPPEDWLEWLLLIESSKTVVSGLGSSYILKVCRIVSYNNPHCHSPSCCCRNVSRNDPGCIFFRVPFHKAK